jgi:AAA family ATP:ADP antiporter
MARSRLYRILSRVVEIKPGEEVIALSLFFYFFFITAPFGFIKPLRNANFLDTWGAYSLPFAYLLTAITVGIIVNFHAKLQVRVSRPVLIISSLIFFTVTCLLFWFLFPFASSSPEWRLVFLFFWVWANIFIAVLNAQFWITVNDVFNPREAKRLIGFFVSGGILGGILGYGATGYLAKRMDSHNLLLIVAGMLVICVFIVFFTFIHKKRKQDIPQTNEGIEKGPRGLNFKACFDTVKSNYYLRLLAAVMAITIVVSTLIDFQYNSVIKVQFDEVNSMASFFGYFNAVILIVPFFFSILLTSNIIKRFGIRVTLLLFPLILLACSVGIGFFPMIFYGALFGFALVIKGMDKSLSFSINQSVRELLYIPVSPELKYKAKIFIDMFLNRFAKGIGAVVLLAVTLVAKRFFGKEIIASNIAKYATVVSIIAAIFIIAWIVLNLKVSKEYANTVKQKLQLKWDRADKRVAEQVDVDYTKLIFDTIESRDRSSVLYAMHIFDLIKQDRLTPEIKKLISYKSDEVKASSLGPLIESELTPLIPEPDDTYTEDILEKEIGEILSLDVYQEVMKSYMEKALKDESLESETARMEMAKAIGMMESDSPLTQKLEELLWDESPDVSRYALESAAKLKKKEYVPALIRKLATPVTMEDARTALEKFGAKIVGALADYLSDSDENIELRRGAASVLARIGSQDAADFLSWELIEGTGEIDTDVIDAMDRIRSENPGIQFSTRDMKKKINQEINNHCQDLLEFHNLKRKSREGEKIKQLERKLTESLMNIFKLLGLVYPREDIAKAYQNIRTGTKDSVAYAIELLDNILEKEMRDAVIPLIEDISLEERVKRCLHIMRTLIDL